VVVTLVVAHPDDECMFFSPAMESIRRYCSKNGESLRMTLVCLSTGDAFGLGRVRAKELVGSCRTYEIREKDVEVVDDQRLRDGMDEVWDPRIVAEYVENHVRDRGTTHIVGFDEKGISRHPNHCACARALELLMLKKKAAEGLGRVGSIWVQETYSGLSQYLGPLTVVWRCLRTFLGASSCGRERVVCTAVTSFLFAFRAMRAHRSQLVWYRYLHLVFSRYVYINVLRALA